MSPFDSALLKIEQLSGDKARLEMALRRQTDNMAFVVNHASLYGFHDTFVAELEEDRKALAASQPLISEEAL